MANGNPNMERKDYGARRNAINAFIGAVRNPNAEGSEFVTQYLDMTKSAVSETAENINKEREEKRRRKEQSELNNNNNSYNSYNNREYYENRFSDNKTFVFDRKGHRVEDTYKHEQKRHEENARHEQKKYDESIHDGGLNTPPASFYSVKSDEARRKAVETFTKHLKHDAIHAAERFVTGTIGEMSRDPNNPAGEFINQTYQNTRASMGLVQMVVGTAALSRINKEMDKLYSKSTREEITQKANDIMEKYGINTVKFESEFTDIHNLKDSKGKDNPFAGTFYEKSKTNPDEVVERIQFTADNASRIVKDARDGVLSAYTKMQNDTLREKTKENIEKAFRDAGVEIKDVTDKNIQMMMMTGQDASLRALLGQSPAGNDAYKTLRKNQNSDVMKYNRDVQKFSKALFEDNGLNNLAKNNEVLKTMLGNGAKSGDFAMLSSKPRFAQQANSFRAAIEVGMIFEGNVTERQKLLKEFDKQRDRLYHGSFYVTDRIMDFFCAGNETLQEIRSTVRTASFIVHSAGNVVKTVNKVGKSIKDARANRANVKELRDFRKGLKASEKLRVKEIRDRKLAEKLAQKSADSIFVRYHTLRKNTSDWIVKARNKAKEKAAAAVKNTTTAIVNGVSNSIPVKAGKKVADKATGIAVKAGNKVINVRKRAVTTVRKQMSKLGDFVGRKALRVGAWVDRNPLAKGFMGMSKWGVKRSRAIIDATRKKMADISSKYLAKKAAVKAAGKAISMAIQAALAKIKLIILAIVALTLCGFPIIIGAALALIAGAVVPVIVMFIILSTVLGFVVSILQGILGLVGLDQAQVNAYTIQKMYEMEVDWYDDQWALAAKDAMENGYELYQIKCANPFTREIIEDRNGNSSMVSNVRDIVACFDVLQNYYATLYAGYTDKELDELRAQGKVTEDDIIIKKNMNRWVQSMIDHTHHGLVAKKGVGPDKLVQKYTRRECSPSLFEILYGKNSNLDIKESSLKTSAADYYMYYSLSEYKHNYNTYSRDRFFGDYNRYYNDRRKYATLENFGCTAAKVEYDLKGNGSLVDDEYDYIWDEDDEWFPKGNISCAGHTIATYYITVDMFVDCEVGVEEADGSFTLNEGIEIDKLNPSFNYRWGMHKASTTGDGAKLIDSYYNTFGATMADAPNPTSKEALETASNAIKIAFMKICTNWKQRYGILMPRGETEIPLGGMKSVYESYVGDTLQYGQAVIFKDFVNDTIRHNYFADAFKGYSYSGPYWHYECEKPFRVFGAYFNFNIDARGTNDYWEQYGSLFFKEGEEYNAKGIYD